MSLAGSFLRPEWWPLLLLVPAAAIAFRLLELRRVQTLSRVLGPRMPVLTADAAFRRHAVRIALVSAAFACAALAAMQPVWGEATSGTEQRGVDVVVCLDVSRSMLARDVAPSRLLRARAEMRALAERAVGDRLGLVVFAGEARVAVPLTRDAATFADLAGQADPLSVQRGGTDLGAALTTATDAIEDASGEHATVIVLTDGEDGGGRGLRAAQACRDRGVVVHCVGFGSARGAKIAVEGDGGEAFLRDRAGNEVVSVMDAAALRRIAGTTGGEFADAASAPQALVSLYERRVLPMARKTFDTDDRRERENRFQWPLAAACVLLIVELAMPNRRRR